jgi:hypothetical protein
VILARLRALPRTELVVLVLAIALLVGLSIATQEARKPAPLASYSSYDAQSGGTRALYELYAREGFDVERFERQTVFLDRSTGTLVWIEPLEFDPAQRVPTEAETKALESWVRGGGKFLYVGHDAGAARQKYLRIPATREVRTARAKPYVDPALRAFGVGPIVANGTLRYVPRARQRVLLADARGPIVLRYTYGRGLITTVVDEDLFSNDGIGRGDRARLAYALVATTRPGTIAFEEALHGYFVPLHWWEIAPRAFVVSVIVALAALGIAGIGAAIRFGPPVLPAPRDDATTSDFIGALAGLLRAGGARRNALVTAADSTTRALARSFALGDRASAHDVAAHLEREGVRSDYETMLAVANNGYPDDANLIRGVALAQRLRKDHAAHVDRRR